MQGEFWESSYAETAALMSNGQGVRRKKKSFRGGKQGGGGEEQIDENVRKILVDPPLVLHKNKLVPQGGWEFEAQVRRGKSLRTIKAAG